MREYARRRTDILLRHLSVQVRRATRSGDAAAIHDLRVAIRRLSRCLRAFAQFYPGRSWKRARAGLSDLLHAAGAVRDRDIALEMLARAGIARRSAIVTRLRAERAEAHAEFVSEIRGWRDRHAAQKWRSRLEVEG